MCKTGLTDNHCVTVTEQIITGIAALENTSPTDLPPLYESTDPDALDALAADGIHIQFTYSDHAIEVQGGDVTIDP